MHILFFWSEVDMEKSYKNVIRVSATMSNETRPVYYSYREITESMKTVCYIAVKHIHYCIELKNMTP